MKSLFSLLVILALVVGATPVTCLAYADTQAVSGCGCSSDAPAHGGHDPTQGDDCACSISPCQQLLGERLDLYRTSGAILAPAAVSVETGRLTVAAYTGEAFVSVWSPLLQPPGISDHISSVRLLL
ncbi:MAG: hypothetical protein ACQKBW_09020 [Puniceicoccales bacterium]